MERDNRPPIDHTTMLTAYHQAAERARARPTDRNLRRVVDAEASLVALLLDETVGRFSLGRLVATPGAIGAMDRSGDVPHEFLVRHKFGDWGELDEEDKQVNEFALQWEQAEAEGRPLENVIPWWMMSKRLFSRYATHASERLYVITEHDRSVTTLLLPEEY